MTVDTDDVFKLICDNGFKQKSWQTGYGLLTIDYSGPYNIRSDCRLYHFKNKTIEFDFEWLTIYIGYKKIFRCTLSEKPGWGNNDPVNYLQIPEPVIYFIINKEFKPKEKRRYIPRKIMALIFEIFGHKCKECHATENLEVDHIYPFSKGGSNNKENLQILCKPCNRKKFNKLPQ